ncbi:DNA-directed RNA polymerase III subunit RPC2, partial [Zancudomyces culisetae]
MLCPSDTPEGELCGLVKNLALMTHITTDDEAEPIEKALFMLGVEDISLLSGTEIYDKGSYVVMLNGALVGVTRAVGRLLREFRKLRRRGYISYFVSISLDEDKRVVNVAADNGRIVRPLLIVENGELRVKKEDIGLLVAGKLTFDDFLRQGKVEYLDVNEENDSNIVLETSEIGPTTTHVEIEPFTILGAVAGLIPFPHHNQSPRNTYQSAMGKQAIGAIAYNQFERIDTLLYLMVYPQQPMVKTRTIELIGYDRLPAGQNAIVAVMSYSGYDIEDALVINKSSIDRGFGRCQVMRKYAALIKKYPNGSYDRIVAAPVDEEGNTPFKYSVVEPDGIGAVGEPLQPGCIVINKQVPSEITAIDMPSQPPSQLQFKPMPTTYRSPELSYLDKVVLTNTESDQVLVKCLLRQTRRPELGDKFSSRHGQKGVCGLIVEQQDFPFNDWGICPDVIMNPHGFPSRMTIGKMLELLYGKAGVLDGKLQYGTAFRKNDFAYLSSVLLENGFSYTGKDYLTSGITGDPIQAYIFFGPIYYQKLKHMVMDKMHARARGPRTVLTRQPTGGRS